MDRVLTQKSASKSKYPGNENSSLQKKNEKTAQRLKEVVLLLGFAIIVFMALALYSFHAGDTSFNVANGEPIKNLGGEVGANLAGMILAGLGYVGFLLPLILVAWIFLAFKRFRSSQAHGFFLLLMRFVGFVLLLVSGTGFLAVAVLTSSWLPQGPGGILGQVVGSNMDGWLGPAGSLWVLLVATLIALTLLFGIRWSVCGRGIIKAVIGSGYLLVRLFRGCWRVLKAKLARSPKGEVKKTDKVDTDFTEGLNFAEAQQEPSIKKNSLKAKASKKSPSNELEIIAVSENVSVSSEQEATSSKPLGRGKRIKGDIPSVDILDTPEPSKNTITKESLEHMAHLVEEKLADFNIAAKVMGACPGPIVTRFELQLAPGMKVSKLTNIGKDLARSLAAISVRVVEVIPGKPYVGLEIPNAHREIVRLKEVVSDKKFKEHQSPLYMGLGKDISGKPAGADLAKMPHVLVAGTTGSGKSVGLNAMLLSMLLRAKPEQLRLIMIDPKMLELSIYEGIPHLLTPVVTDMNQAANALRWCVKEMDQRYRLMASLGVRNIAGLNQKIKEARDAGNPLKDPLYEGVAEEEGAPELEAMPYIVVLVDEFADMMMVVGKKVEELIARLAQKARAAGIHLILATQRPSVDVITGLIKANIPSRMAFQVSSKIDSRTILDQQGAEQLLGYGDMLYLPPGTGVPIRVHGAFVADHEVHNVVAAWKALGEPDYIDAIVKTDSLEEGEGEAGSAEEQDPLYDEAVQIVIQTQRASISAIQRRLKIGYNRAARLVEAMELAGLVSEIQSNGMREVLISK